MDNGGCGGCLGGLIAIIAGIAAIIYVIVKFVIPFVLAVGAIVLAIAGVIGAIIGLVVAIKNFIEAIGEVRVEHEELGGFRNDASKIKYNDNKSAYSFEDVAARSYFFGPCFKDVGHIIAYSFANNFDSMPDFSRGENWFTRLWFIVLSTVQLLAIVILGTAFTLALSIILLAIFLVLEVIVLAVMGIVLLFEHIYFVSRQIAYRCPICKNEYKIPTYECPICNIKHKHLKPGLYGILRRKCVCGTRLPVSVRVKGWYSEKDPESGYYFQHPVKFEELKSYCTYCGTEHNAGLSKPTSIALIGGASAGKTTFKVAFINDLFETEMIKYGIDYEFPDPSDVKEYEDALQYYKGLRIIASTGKGMANDISTFSFSLKHKKFNASRMLHIYDMPGETFQSGDAKEGWENYTFTEGAVFLVDPYSIPAIKAEHQGEIGTMGVCEMHMDRLNDSLIDTLRQVKVKKRNGKFTIPIALTINKVDSPLLKKLVGADAVINLMSAHPDVFTDYFVTMDYICRCFIVKYGGINFIANLDNNFETVHFFFSSPMGYVPKATRVRFSPINVLPIMQWMMLRADKQLGKVWKPEIPVRDLTEEQKKLYLTHPEYYDEYVAGQLEHTQNV